jgi:hypothetical protein
MHYFIVVYKFGVSLGSLRPLKMVIFNTLTFPRPIQREPEHNRSAHFCHKNVRFKNILNNTEIILKLS